MPPHAPADAPATAHDYFCATLFVALAVGVRAAMQPALGDEAPLIVLVAAPALAAAWGGRGPGLYATVLAGFAGVAAFVPPRGWPLPPDLVEWVRLAIYFGEGVVLTVVVASRRSALARLRREHTTLQATQQALEARERRFHATLEAAPSAMLVVDVDERIVLANATAERLFGWPRAELEALTLDAVVPAADRAGHRARVADFFAQPETRAMGAGRELHARRRDGTDVPVEVALNPFVGEDGRALVLASLVDVSARRAAEAARAAAAVEQAQLAAIVLHSADAMFTTTLEGRVASWNAGAERLYGWSAAEAVGAPFARLLPPERSAEELARLAELARGTPVADYDTEHCARDGRGVPVAVTLSPILDDAGRVVRASIVARDVTERRMREAQLREQARLLDLAARELEARVAARTRELQEANRELEAFAHTVAHDLRAPLRNLQGFATALLEDYADRLDEEGRDYARRLAAGAQRMDRLIVDLLAYARLTRAELRLEAVPLAGAVEAARTELAAELASCDAGLSLAGCLDATVRAQRTVLVQALANLLGNACKFRRPGTRARIQLDAQRRDGIVRVSVRDDGIGIAPEHQQRIFEVFERLHGQETYPGTGIGLAIVRRGMERMGGSVGVRSAPGEGSTFWFELPAAEAGTAGAAEPAS